MRNRCDYCYNLTFEPDDTVCERCKKQVKKLDQETVNWLMMVIDCRIDKELDKHTDRYNHEDSKHGYC